MRGTRKVQRGWGKGLWLERQRSWETGKVGRHMQREEGVIERDARAKHGIRAQAQSGIFQKAEIGPQRTFSESEANE
jgi:hypothetical protein